VRWVHIESGEEVCKLGGYSVLLADCPWSYNVAGGRGAADKHYSTMSLAELCMLPVEQLAAPDAVLFLWGVWPQLLEAHAVMKAWGFAYKNCGFVWIKTNKLQPTPFVGLGRWTRGNSEFCLMGVRGKPQRADAAVQQIVDDSLVVTPINEHSAKPQEVRDRIMQLMGDVPAVELFARNRDPRFDVWGNEVESTIFLQP
jgi:N6-adenosine-specific RNA methylase IME4